MIIDSLLSLLAPHECLGCGAEASLLCQTCITGLAPAERRCYKCLGPDYGNITCQSCRGSSDLVSLHAATPYQGMAKDIIWKLKFGRTASAGQHVAAIIDARLPLGQRLQGRNNLIVTHAPTATSRVRQRGYDQAQLIARALARRYKLPYAPLLARRGSQKQVGADRSQRVAQLASAFHAVNGRRIRGAHIVLIDDVVTTGATLEAAAAALMQAGARRVDAIVFAQA